MNETENQVAINRYFGVNDEPCHWCGTTRFQHDGFHLVHVGGQPADVYGCDKCLNLTPPDFIDLLDNFGYPKREDIR